MSVADDAVKAAAAGLDFQKPLDRLRGAYVRRRVDALHHDNSGWGATKLASQVKAEMAAVDDYLKRKKGLIDGTDGVGTPPLAHLDLKIEAALVTLSLDNGSFGQPFFDGIQKELQTNRSEVVTQVVWRAAAVQASALWKSASPAKLQEAAFDELVDRRLRAVEQMLCAVNTFYLLVNHRHWDVQGPSGPWLDGFRTRCFEYPQVAPLDPFASVLPQMTDWRGYTDSEGGGVVFDPPSHVGVRVPTDVKAAFRLDPSFAWINFHPMSTSTPADIVEFLFTPKTDFWDRSWLYCDQVGSLVNLEALWFGLKRRTKDDKAFNDVMNKADYVRLGPVVGGHDTDHLMSDDQDPYFENVDIDFEDLQVGDFVRFWNSRIYALLPPYSGAWTSEFSLVMALDMDGKSGTIPKPASGGPQVWLSGHGVPKKLYSALATETTDALVQRFRAARALLPSDRTTNSVTDQGQRYVRWSPYEDFESPGAWWVEIPSSQWQDHWGYTNQDQVLKSVPRTVAAESGGAGYHPPPDTNAVYFPLFEPEVPQTDADGDSWRAYLRLRKANANFRTRSSTLKSIAVDGRLAQGLFYRGSKGQVSVVRPRVRT